MGLQQNCESKGTVCTPSMGAVLDSVTRPIPIQSPTQPLRHLS
jgi:hypothetical protein